MNERMDAAASGIESAVRLARVPVDADAIQRSLGESGQSLGSGAFYRALDHAVELGLVVAIEGHRHGSAGAATSPVTLKAALTEAALGYRPVCQCGPGSRLLAKRSSTADLHPITCYIPAHTEVS